jgi:hypothetical protein
MPYYATMVGIYLAGLHAVCSQSLCKIVVIEGEMKNEREC